MFFDVCIVTHTLQRHGERGKRELVMGRKGKGREGEEGGNVQVGGGQRREEKRR